MLIIPAIDIRGGLCVRLTQGDFARERVYDSDPARVAEQFAEQGARWIHVVDLDGAKAGEIQNGSTIEAIVKTAGSLGAEVEVGGGIRSLESGQRLLDAGVSRIVVGTKLVQDPGLAKAMFDEFGGRVVAGIDARDGKAATAGWLEQSQVTAVELAKRLEDLGAQRIILTDIAQDGMLAGPNLDLLRQVGEAVALPIIHSGGIGSLADLELLYDMGDLRAEGVIVGRAIYEGHFSVADAIELSASFGR